MRGLYRKKGAVRIAAPIKLGGICHGEDPRRSYGAGREKEEEAKEGQGRSGSESGLRHNPTARAGLARSALGIARRLGGVLLALPLLLSARPVLADDPNTLADRLTQVRYQAQQGQQHLSELQRQQSQLQGTITALRAQLEQGNAELASLSGRAQAVEAQIGQAEARLEQQWRAYETQLQAFRSNVRREYQLGSSRWLEFLLSARSFSDLLNRVIYLEKFPLAQLQVATHLRSERDAIEAERNVLAHERQELVPLLTAIQARVASLAATTSAAAAYDSELEAARRRTLIQIAGLQAEGRSLETALDRYQAQQAELALKNPGATYGKTCPPAAPAGWVRFCGHGWGHGVGLG